MKLYSSRTALAAVMTLVVVSLLTLAVASNSKTSGYRLYFQGDTPENYRQDRIKVDVTSDDMKKFDIDAPSFETVVRATLHTGPTEPSPTAESTPVRILVHHPTPSGDTLRVDDLRMHSGSEGRKYTLEISAFVFALFGLFVLWWGRDRASLWLGLFCSSFAPSIFQIYGILPEWGMLVGYVVADLLFYLSIYAFYQIAQTFALESMRVDDPLRPKIEMAREFGFSIILFSAAVDFVNTVGPAIFSEPVWPLLVDFGRYARVFAIAGTLGFGPIALLVIGWLRASDEVARGRVRITLITTIVAESGVIAAIWEQTQRGATLGFDNAWYTLLAIPVGFIFSIPAYKVVEVKFVFSRILVLTTMTAIIAGIIVFSQTIFEERVPAYILGALHADEHDKSTFVNVLRFMVAFTIVLTFNRLHFILDEFFKALFFRRRDEAVKSLHDFAMHRAQFITVREELLQQAIALVCTCVGTRGSAFYEEAGAGYELASTCGDVAWVPVVGENDPAFTLLRAGRERVDLASLDPTPSILGTFGTAIRMGVSSSVLSGALVVGPRAKEGAGPYGAEELEALEDIARSVSEALFNLRANETAEFIRGVADGSIRGSEALAKAEMICERGLPGVDTSFRTHAAKRAIVPRMLRPPLARADAGAVTWLPSLESEPQPNE